MNVFYKMKGDRDMSKQEFCFIVPEDEEFSKEKVMPASYIRKTFVVEEEIKQASLKMTALGVYLVYVNGQRVSQALLMPGFTNYHVRLQYQTFDIAPLLQKGKNTICVILGNGWYRGCLGITGDKAYYGDRLQLAACLDIDLASGKHMI